MTIHDKIKNSTIINLTAAGHASSFTNEGTNIIKEFIKNPALTLNQKEIKSKDKLTFQTDIIVNGGIPNFANALNEPNFLFFSPLIIAVLIILLSIFLLIYYMLKSKYGTVDKILRSMIIITSIIGLTTLIGFVLAINETSNGNFYILAFGLNQKYNYLFTIQWLFLILTSLSVLLFFLKIKKVTNESVILTILFSIVLINVYYFYLGFYCSL